MAASITVRMFISEVKKFAGFFTLKLTVATSHKWMKSVYHLQKQQIEHRGHPTDLGGITLVS